MARRTRNTSGDTATDTKTEDITEVASRRRRRKATDDEPEVERPKAASGWDSYDTAKEETKSQSSGDYISFKDDIWKPDSEETLVYFLDDEPFAVYYDVWVPAKKRSYSTMSADNPLTENLAEKAQPRALFNVVVFEEDEDENLTPTLKVLQCAVTLAELVKSMAEGKRTSPLSKYYWEMSATGKQKNYVPKMNNYKPEDLPEMWGTDPLSDEELAEFEAEMFTIDNVFISDDKYLNDLVDELMG